MKYIITLILLFITGMQIAFAQFNYINPVPGSAMHNPETGIILKNGNYIDRESVQEKSFVEIHGSLSGNHEWTARLSDDNKTIVIKPGVAFDYGETVLVTIHSSLRKDNGEKINGTSFSFSIRNKLTPEEEEQHRIANLLARNNNDDLELPGNNEKVTYPLDSMPTYKITTNNNPAAGQIFYTSHAEDVATGNQSTNSFPTIINNDGSIVWALDAGKDGADFKINHNGYITYFATVKAQWMVMDSNFNLIDSVMCTNGYESETNVHDFQMFPDGHVFLQAYDIQTMDLTSYGGLPNATVYGLILQELDANRDLVFEWRSWDHFLLTDANAYTPLTNSIVDYCHGNAIEVANDGNILISCRNMNEITKIDHATGNIIWRLGGENNQFTFVNDNIVDHFHSQHDLRQISNGDITLYNNGNQLPVLISSAKEYALDEVNKVATLVWYYEHPDVNGFHVYSGATGSVQRLPNGNTLIDWGIIATSATDVGFPDFTEVDANKNIVWEMKFDSADQKSYRIHKYVWNPCSRITGYTMKSYSKPMQVTLKWDAATGAKKYKVDYRKLGASTWTSASTNKAKLILTGLSSNSFYEWKVKTICSGNGSVASVFSVTDTFKTKQMKLTDEENNLENISIYPVPASDYLTIDNINAGNTAISITNSLGAIVYEKNITSQEPTSLGVDVKQWPAGIYVVQLKNDTNQVAKKILVE